MIKGLSVWTQQTKEEQFDNMWEFIKDVLRK